MAGVGATSPAGTAGAAAAAAAAAPAPDVFGLNKGTDTSVAYTDGQFTRDAIKEKILKVAIEPLTWANQQLNGATPKKAKRPEIIEGFKKSAADLTKYATELKSLITTLGQKELKQFGTAASVEELSKELKVIEGFAKIHESMSKGNYTIDQATKGKNTSAIFNNTFLLMGKKAMPEVRQTALAITTALRGVGAKPINGLLESKKYKTLLDAQQAFLTSAPIQAITPSLGGKTRTAMQNPGLAA